MAKDQQYEYNVARTMGVCVICEQKILVMAFKNTGVCSDNHRKEAIQAGFMKGTV